MAFEEEGFCVVRGPDALWGGDVRTFTPPAGKFDGVIGGPPCQAFSRLRHIIMANGYELADNLIPEFERIISVAQPEWFLMENVPDAPDAKVDGYGVHRVMVNDATVGGRTSRERKFNYGMKGKYWPLHVQVEALWSPDPERAVTCDAREVPVAIGGSGKRKLGGALPRTGKKMSLARMCELQGLPRDFLDDAPFTAAGKAKVVGNGVPLAMGRAVARAIKESLPVHRERAA